MEVGSYTPKEAPKSLLLVRHATTYTNYMKQNIISQHDHDARNAIAFDLKHVDQPTIPESELEINQMASKLRSRD